MHMEPECKQESNVNIVDILIASLHFVYWECKFVSKFLFWNKNEKILSFNIFHFANFEISASF